MEKYIYIRPTYSHSGKSQNKAILDTFFSEQGDLSEIKRYTERRLEIRRFECLLNDTQSGDYIYVHSPAIFGIGVERAVENIRKVLAKGAKIWSVLYGEINEEWASQIEVAGNIVRECCEIDRYVDDAYHKGVREDVGGYFEDGVWYYGQRKSYEPPYWAYHKSQRKVDVSNEMRESAAARWVDMKIMQAWTTERIYSEYMDLRKVMPDWGKLSKQWINMRRVEITR